MKKLDMVVVWALQLLVLLFFSFVVLLWYGCATLIPLAMWLKLSQAIAPLTGPAAATALALVMVSAMGIYLARASRVFDAFLETGAELFKLGQTSLHRISEKMLPVPELGTKSGQIILEDKFS
jgi:hypothetical protein